MIRSTSILVWSGKDHKYAVHRWAAVGRRGQQGLLCWPQHKHNQNIKSNIAFQEIALIFPPTVHASFITVLLATVLPLCLYKNAGFFYPIRFQHCWPMQLELNIKGGTVSLTNHIWSFWKITEEITFCPTLWGECVTFRDPTWRARGRFAVFGVMVRYSGMFEGS